jgi:hypothetical protein
MSYSRRSQTVSEFLENILPTAVIRRMLRNRGYQTLVMQAIDGNQNRHLVNNHFGPIEVGGHRAVFFGETFCGRGSHAFKDVRKKGVTCEGCIHISRSVLARKMLSR